MIHQALEELNKSIVIRPRYDNFIGGKWVPPVRGQYFSNPTPVTGRPLCEVARSTAEDIEKALDAAHAAKDAWGKTSPAERSRILNKIADRMEERLPVLAMVETLDNGKPIRETTAADLPLAVDHFRYFAGCIRAQEGSVCEIDHTTYAYHFHEPLGVVGQIIPWNFPLLMAAWKVAPALAAGNCVVLKPAEQTPMGILVWADIVGDLLPPGVLNIVNGFGVEAGKPLATNKRIAKIAFTGETTTGRLIMQYAAENIIPVTLELGGKSPNIFFADVMAEDDAFQDKALEGFAMFALNQGEVCTCPSRALIQESIYDRFMEKAIARVKKMKQGNPLDPDDDGRRPGLQRPAREDPLLHRHRPQGGRQDPDRRRAGQARGRAGDRLLRPADGLRGPQQDARLPGGNLRPVRFGDHVQDRGGGARRSPTTRSTASAPGCGRATATAPSASPTASKPAACGSTATTSIRRTRRSAATSSPASAARTTR